jgi:2,3-bisphosphoglycerate-independent phosphoglycerate mutase
MEAQLNKTLLPQIARRTDSRIVFIVLDGLGGVLGEAPTALQASKHPNLDALASRSALGRHIAVAHGVTGGSGPGHFAIFGYDPLGLDVGRGLLEALGVGVDVRPGDVAIRGNYCTVDDQGILVDRRAGRIPTDQSAALTAMLATAMEQIEGARVEMHPGLQHRFAAVLRGTDLGADVADTDPQVKGVPPLLARARHARSGKTARIANAIVERAREVLGDRDVANSILLRGFSSRPDVLTLAELALLRPCAIAAYPAYRGVAAILGMDLIDGVGPTSSIADEVDALERVWNDGYDFFFLHVEATDSAGVDGDEERKGRVIEDFDAQLARIVALEPDVIVVTGEHSTPGPLAGHSWHPVPLLISGPWTESKGAARFDEVSCHEGRLGCAFPAPAILRMAMAQAGKLAKYGA